MGDRNNNDNGNNNENGSGGSGGGTSVVTHNATIDMDSSNSGDKNASTTSSSSSPSSTIPSTSLPKESITSKLPALTAEERAQRRKQLLEKQKAILQKGTASSPSTTSIPSSPTTAEIPKDNIKQPEISSQPNPDLVQKAIQFLSSPSVQQAPLEKRLHFLRSKGLSDADIQSALSQVSASSTTTTITTAQPLLSQPQLQPVASQPYLPPPIPPRPQYVGNVDAPLNNTHLISQNKQQQQLQRRFQWKPIIYLIAFLAAAGSASLHYLKRLFKESLKPFIEQFYLKYLSDQKAKLLEYVMRLVSVLRLFGSKRDDKASKDTKTDSADSVTLESSLSNMIDSTTKSLAKLTESTESYLSKLAPKPLPTTTESGATVSTKSTLAELESTLTSVVADLSNELYNAQYLSYYSSLPSSSTLAANQNLEEHVKKFLELRNDIRGLKGLLISRKNFGGNSTKKPYGMLNGTSAMTNASDNKEHIVNDDETA